MKYFAVIGMICGLCACVVGCGTQAKDTGDAPPAAQREGSAVESGPKPMSDDQQSLAGIELQPLLAAPVSDRVSGQATVLGHDTVAQAVADVRASEATAAQSAAALKRIQGLQSTRGALGEDALEIARRQAAVDSAQRDLARRKAAAQFGAGSSHLSPDQWESLADGRLHLVRVVMPEGTPIPADAKSLRFVSLDGHQPEEAWHTLSVWPAPAEAGIPGMSLLSLVEGSGMAEGARLLAEIDRATAIVGVLIPASAAVMHDGKLWCFVSQKAGEFTRRAIDDMHPTQEGYVQRAGYRAGERVVVRGAGLLLAREFGTAEDEP